MRGKFIVVDGGEGSGKGTCLTELRKVLPDGTVFTREPGGTLVSERIRELLKSDINSGSSALTNFLLFWAARSDLIENVIRPALAAGRNVVSDRYDMSTWAYQICGQQNADLQSLFLHIRHLISEDVQPDLYIYLDVLPEEGMRRTAGRGGQDHFDLRDIEFHRRVRAGYLDFVKRYNGVVINSNRPLEYVVRDFITTVEGILSQPIRQ
jgi:dTMP kinase